MSDMQPIYGACGGAKVNKSNSLRGPVTRRIRHPNVPFGYRMQAQQLELHMAVFNEKYNQQVFHTMAMRLADDYRIELEQ